MRGQKQYDVDEVAVERAVKGDLFVPLNPAEMQAAYELLSARDTSITQTAAILGVSPRAVSRWRNGLVYFHARRRVNPEVAVSPVRSEAAGAA